jgi:hypothetical protein
MSDTDLEVIILKDLQGEYYLLPREGLEQAKVPAEYRAEVERMIEEAGPAEGELSDDQLEAVAGGFATRATTVKAPSGLSFQGISGNWQTIDFRGSSKTQKV